MLGIPPTTVAQYDRQLAEAGLRTKAGRGPSAAKITPTDASNLLLAILGAPVSGPSIKLAKQTCEACAEIPVVQKLSDARQLRQFRLLSASELPKKHTFRDALVALIKGAMHGEFFWLDGFDRNELDTMLWVQLSTPIPWAQISCFERTSLNTWECKPRLTYSWHKHKEYSTRWPRADLHQERRITFATLQALGRLIAGEDVLADRPEGELGN
jgi:hypothetical protein